MKEKMAGEGGYGSVMYDYSMWFACTVLTTHELGICTQVEYIKTQRR